MVDASAENAGLPRALGGGLTLRWATPDDIAALVEHNVFSLSDHPEAPNEGMRGWIRELMDGSHPTTSAGDFTIVVDEGARGKIVSSMCLISQTWAYAGIPFKVGRPEAVSTDPAYRRRGLVREQFAAIHARSAARGELVQAIDGVAWYYRQFGYEMALNLGGTRRLLPFRISRQGEGTPAFTLRPATGDDMVLLQQLYALHCRGGLVTRLRDDTELRYEMGYKKFWIVQDAAGVPVGYAEARVSEGNHDPELERVFSINELAVLPGNSLRAVAEFVAQELDQQMAQLNKTREIPLTSLLFNLGARHAVYDALGDLLERFHPYYAWYIRVPDLAAFLLRIAPVLEQRLAASVMAGHSGTLRLNLYRSQLALIFSNGKLAEIGTFSPQQLEDGDARFPDLTFLHVLMGHRTPTEIEYLFADCYVNSEARVLLGILFPQQPSNPLALS